MNVTNENKLLNRQLKSTILDLKTHSLKSLLTNFEMFTGTDTEFTFHKKGLKCAECVIVLQDIVETGFGRTNEEAQGNAIKSLFDSVIEKGFRVQELKQSLRLTNKSECMDHTLDLSYIDLLNSRIVSRMDPKTATETLIQEACLHKVECSVQQTQDRCRLMESEFCVHQQLYIQQSRKVANLEARIKLLSQENSLLKECLLKDFSNKENRNTCNSVNGLRS